ncbi:MAG: hypothetical protein ABSD59_15770 [Terracidiphilus sp.]|jgi:hypothetical protein
MALTELNERERGIVRECLRAAVEGPFFPEWEFPTIFGLERNEVRNVLDSWPQLDESDEKVAIAINNTLNNFLSYPLGEDQAAWPQFISVSRSELKAIFEKWMQRTPRTARKPRDYFEDAL